MFKTISISFFKLPFNQTMAIYIELQCYNGLGKDGELYLVQGVLVFYGPKE